jgi:hypothetical protein
MSAIDLPPGIGLVGAALQRFTSPPAARRLARATVFICIGCGAATWAMVARNHGRADQSVYAVMPLALGAVAVLGWLIRSASITVARDGLRWGWQSIAFTRRAETIVQATAYLDGVALAGRRGAPWFLAAADWQKFPDLVRQLQRAQLPVVQVQQKAPWRAKMQSYGRALDIMLLLSCAGAIVVAVAAITQH